MDKDHGEFKSPGAAQGLQNPTEKYPKPPFSRQKQDWPGLACKMHPAPDHGENSYRGSGRLLGRKALITGGDSGMGRAAAIAFAREGADVAINYFRSEQEDADQVIALIREAGRKAVAIPGDLRDKDFCRKMVPDMVLLDWNMPEMDGISCLRALRAMALEPRPIVVMCTTESSFSKIQEALEAGADEYIMKPYDREVLLDKLVQVGLVERA